MTNKRPIEIRCLYCPEHWLMNKRLHDPRLDPDSLYGVVPLTKDGLPQEGARPYRVHVYVCNSCGFVALFSQNVEENWEIEARLQAELIDRELRGDPFPR